MYSTIALLFGAVAGILVLQWQNVMILDERRQNFISKLFLILEDLILKSSRVGCAHMYKLGIHTTRPEQ